MIPRMTLHPLYHDNHLLALNKPAGLLTQPSGTARDNLEDQAKEYIKQIKNKPGNVYLHAVHRIDRVVSGIVLFACTDKALSRLNADLRARRFKKTYLALVHGVPPQDKGTLSHFLTHGDFRADVVSADAPGARECRLDYKTLNRSESLSMLEIELHTGRYHQIRAQLAAVGCPIYGDGKYGAPSRLPGGTIALHHTLLGITHPTQKTGITLQAPPPVQWEALLPGTAVRHHHIHG
jgi:23S rRNA pseudouridine1911/1915/1917 synthase